MTTALTGRDGELARAEAFLGSTHDGAASLLLEGEAGIGKTTLWRVGVERARELGFRVLEARPASSERELAFAALGDLLEGAHDEIGGLPGPQRRALRIALMLEDATGEPPEQRAIAAALLGLLRRLAEEESVLIALDDVQWLDTPSSAALEFALRRLGGEPVGVIATARVRETDTVLDATERLIVGPLPLSVLDQLCRERLRARFLRPTLRQLEEASGGNPFYALEIAAGVLRSGRRLAPGDPLPIPGSLRDVVRERLATLSPEGRHVALAASALAQPTVTTVEDATGEGLEPVSEAVAAGILARDGEALRFTHPLLAATLYEDASRARHLAEAVEARDDQVAEVLEAAARIVAARGAPEAAVNLARRAFDLTPPGRRRELHRRRLDWARYVFTAGDPQSPEALLERHQEDAERGRDRAEVLLELGRVRLPIHGDAAACECFERSLREIEGEDELELCATILTALANRHVDRHRWDSDASDRALELAERSARPDLIAGALAVHGAKLVMLGQPPSVHDERARSRGSPRRGLEPRDLGASRRRRRVAHPRRSVDEAASHLRRLVELTDPLDLPTLDGFVARAQGLVASAQGDMDAALRHLRDAVAAFDAFKAPWPFEHARTLLMLGGTQRRARHKQAARMTLGQALGIFERLGACLWAEKTRAELRRLGGRPSRRTALTAAEQSIADLVAAGRSNAEVAHELFISPKTVEWNLSKIYRKLHVRSRAELAAKFAKKQATAL